MLFLVRVDVAEAPACEASRLAELVEAEWTMVLDLFAAGRIKACGKLKGMRSAVAIFEMESAAALDAVVARLPLAPYFCRLEVHPLDPPERALAMARRWTALQRDRAIAYASCPENDRPLARPE